MCVSGSQGVLVQALSLDLVQTSVIVVLQVCLDARSPQLASDCQPRTEVYAWQGVDVHIAPLHTISASVPSGPQ